MRVTTVMTVTPWEGGEPGPEILVIAAIIRRPAGPPPDDREPSDAEKALAASYERFADPLAEIQALRSGRQMPCAGSAK